MQLKDKVSLVTGGANGIGAAAALDLASRGSDISIVHLESSDGDKVKSQIEQMGRRCIVIKSDLSEPEAATRCVAQTADELGGVDVLVHSAGGVVLGGLLDVEPDRWHHAFDIHVHAIFYLCRAVAPLMKKRGEGAIVLISSGAGARGCAGAIAYGVAKGTLPQFARALARELADDNIRVNAVSPGIIRTRFQDVLTPEQAKNNIENRIPLHREGTPQDVAELISLLVTNEFITGETVPIDGGMSMRMA
jgi:NAD(P)-dependent dehydrogenase (short-subunit alcohol dehydrogenase family)